MTMLDAKCDVCHVNPPIGVASTLIPYSCAYCVECAQRFAQPEIVFVSFYDIFGTDFDKMREGLADAIETFDDGKYITYRQWAIRYKDKTE